jgi:outer membrane receptor protein involved in Fe transport
VSARRLLAALALASAAAEGAPAIAAEADGVPDGAVAADAAAPDPRGVGAPPVTGVRAEAGEEIVVVGTRTPRAAASLPTTVTVVRRDDLARSASPTLDGALRQVPSLATFRRSTSLAADPSSQGLSLRGIGPSAVSRALLLDDGVPVNDPFGGWIAWRSVPRLGLSRVEVAPGGASALYGSFALGGVVALVPRPIGSGVDVETYGGSFGTYGVAARAEGRAGRLAGSLDAEHSGTDGYLVVAPGDRGGVDGRAGARHVTVAGRLEARLAGFRLSAGAGGFDEDQDGGTRFTRAGMRAATARLGAEREGALGTARLTLHGGLRTFTQDRARIPEDRSTEEHAAAQEVPSTDLGGSLLLAASRRADHALSLGADLRRVAATSRETLFPATPGPTTPVAREASGTQWTGGVFAQDAWTPRPALEIAAALRLDGWRNARGRAARTFGDGTTATESFPVRTRTLVSPRLAARWEVAPGAALRASAYRAFRAPTLNELYRPFQVGTVLTASNPALEAEVLTGAEAGPELALPGGVRLRASAFWSRLADPITTVTLEAPREDGATRQRQNLGTVRTRGVEAEASWRATAPLRASVAYTLADARIVSAPGREELVGNALPHDPAHRLSARVDLVRAGRLSGGVEVRWLSRAWEDDRNTLALPAFAVVDASVSRPLGGNVELFGAVENLLDERYLVGRAGVDTVGAPRLVRVGLRASAN